MECSTCREVPHLLSSFVDTFVDFAVSGMFFPKPLKCNHKSPKENPNGASTSPSHPQTRYPSPDRLIAIGDLHGDLKKCRDSLRIARVIDYNDHWIGGNTTVVQIGDVLDRGNDELKILYFLEKLKHEASESDGLVITMNGNHEIMNVHGDFRFVTPHGLQQFERWAFWFCVGNSMKSLCDGLEKPKDLFEGVPSVFPGVRKEFQRGIRARIAALRPKGPISTKFLSGNHTVVIIGESVFVHGGLLQQHVDYGLERINQKVSNWINGLLTRSLSPAFLQVRDSLLWLRIFSKESIKESDCSALEQVLAAIPGAKRMIMGHTIQERGINGACENRAIRIDVGMSKGCKNGLTQVLEIDKNSKIWVLRRIKSLTLVEKIELEMFIPKQNPKRVEILKDRDFANLISELRISKFLKWSIFSQRAN